MEIHLLTARKSVPLTELGAKERFLVEPTRRELLIQSPVEGHFKLTPLVHILNLPNGDSPHHQRLGRDF